MYALRTESGMKQWARQWMPKHVKSAFFQRRKGKTFCAERLSEQQAKPSWLFFPLLWHLSICDFLWFAPCSPEPLLLWLDFDSIQCILLPFGRHLDHGSSLSRERHACLWEALLPSSPGVCSDPVIPLTGANSAWLLFSFTPFQSPELAPNLVRRFWKILEILLMWN